MTYSKLWFFKGFQAPSAHAFNSITGIISVINPLSSLPKYQYNLPQNEGISDLSMSPLASYPSSMAFVTAGWNCSAGQFFTFSIIQDASARLYWLEERLTIVTILTLYLIKAHFNTFANRTYPDQAALRRAAWSESALLAFGNMIRYEN